MLKSLLPVATFCFLIGSSCSAPSAHRFAQTNAQAPGTWPKLLAVYMPWFGDHDHIDVGYSSNDPAVLHRQIQQARVKGITAFVVDWYGPSRPFTDHNFALLEQAAEEEHFQVALLYNESEDDDGQATDEALTALNEAYKSYIGPDAPHRGAYLTFNDRPVIFIFPKHQKVDWNAISERVHDWQNPPLFIYKDEPPQQYAAAFAGFYPWVQPGHDGWKPDGSNWGQQYLDNFYKNMKTKRPDKITIGAAWPGFNDSAAHWGLNRHMAARCGKTLEETTRLYGRYYDDANPLPFLLIETWNDYEEGTAIERLNYTDCHAGN